MHVSKMDAEALQGLQAAGAFVSPVWTRTLAGGAEVSTARAQTLRRFMEGGAVHQALADACEKWGLEEGTLRASMAVPVRYTTGAALKLFHWDIEGHQYANMLVGVQCGGVVGGCTFYGNGRFKLQLQDGEVVCWRSYGDDGRLLHDACHGVGVVMEGVRVVLVARIHRRGGWRRPDDVQGQVDALLGKRARD